MVPRPQSSAAGVLALLTEQEPLLKQHALNTLISLVPQFWAEISEHIALIESLYESQDLPIEARNSAALLSSKVYYYLEEYDEALTFALGAGNAFQQDGSIPGDEEYIETLISKAIDRYIESRAEEQSGTQAKVDPRLQDIIESIFSQCIQNGEYKQAIGIALESRRLDIIEQLYEKTHDSSLLAYSMEAVLDNHFPLSYRDQVLNFLYPLFPSPTLDSKSPYIHSLTRLLVTLSNPALTVSLLVSLVPEEKLVAYQLAFDLVEGGAQDFLEAIRNDLPVGDEVSTPIFETLRKILGGRESVKLYLEFLKKNNRADLLILKHTKDSLEPRSSVYHNAVTFQNAFMHAGTTSDTFLRDNLDWLGYASNWSKFTATAALGVIHKGNFEQGMVILGPYLPGENGGESNLAGAAYSEGGALYGLGLINAGVGAISSGVGGRTVEDYLRNILKAAQGEVVQHGAALGLGIAGMGGRNVEAYDDLKQTLFTDTAVGGEAAGYAMGLIMLGTGDSTYANEMLAYARETQHEKIIRGLAVGLAFLYFGRQDQADEIAKELLAEKDPILRYGGVYTLALAYAGTPNNDAVRRLLHTAVSDTSDDVRRAAVTSLAFLLFKNPRQVPRIVQLLSESYNPHVRCGATLALGIACAGTGLQDAIEILEPMTKDSVDFVRQGAFIALGMILVQQSDASSPSLASTRATYAKIVGDKHEDPMARFGAAFGQSFIDAGGRNVTISLQSRAGTKNTGAIVGMVMFCQFWYWYPLAHCASLAFQPTGIIGLTEDLRAPKFDFISNARPSLFAYPSSMKPPKKETTAKLTMAVLSTTAKVKARERRKAASEDVAEGDMRKEGDIEMKSEEVPSVRHGDVSPINESISNLPEGQSSEVRTPNKRKEPSWESLPNFSRVTPAQFQYVVFSPSSRYQPVRPVSAREPAVKAGKGVAGAQKTSQPEKYAGGGGILLLVDERPGEPQEFIALSTAAPPAPQVAPLGNTGPTTTVARSDRNIALDPSGGEAEVPGPFEYPFDDDDA
ncbi:26S proteasome regulatory complex non-ATPase subcomplex Rpn2/Psmd1 subunit [Russula compacta]|nr:26S proteasome regulatory complex non-ATPase subcomplex Rpn2/Psmd1 subunit [Russula compacta]